MNRASINQKETIAKVEKIILIKIQASHLSFTCYSNGLKNKKGTF
jgi:hypothetical protein